MKKKFLLYLIIWVLALCIFNLCAFLPPAEIDGLSRYNSIFWFAYALVTVFFMIHLITIYTVFKKDNLNALFYNMPLIIASVLAIVIMAIIGGLAVALIKIPAWISIVVCAIVFLCNIVWIIKARASSAIIEHVDKKVEVHTAFIKQYTDHLSVLKERTKNTSNYSIINDLYEVVRYSDPMSIKEVEDIEIAIGAAFNTLDAALDKSDDSGIKETAKEISELFKKRNTILLSLK